MRVRGSGSEAIAAAGTRLLRATLLIAGKELRQRLRDRSALVIAFLAPFLLASIIGLAFGSDFTFRATYAVADDDRGPLAAGFVDGVLASPGLREVITVRRVDNVEARALVDRGDADAAFLLPAGFSASVQRGGSATLTVLQSGDSPIAAQVARSLADAYVANLSATQLAVRTVIDASGTTPPTGTAAARLAERAAAAGRLPVQLTEGRVGTREIQAVNYFGPSMAIFFLFFTVSFGARSLLSERRQGTLRRLLASSAPPGAVLAGKGLASFVLGTSSVLVMWLATSLVFGADWGDPLAVVTLTVSSVLAAIGITSLVVTLARTDEQAEGYSSLVVFVLALLGGNFIYLAQLPEALQRVSLLTPNGWALRGFVDLVADGGGLATVAMPVVVTAAVGLATGALALVRGRRLVVA
jgi:linearmycin/streptolysin S transport system permease protein